MFLTVVNSLAGKSARDLDKYEFEATSSQDLKKEEKTDLNKMIRMLPEEKRPFFEDLL